LTNIKELEMMNLKKLQSLKSRIFPLIIAFSALSVSASAAFYSVSGLSKLFAGASLAVTIMASSLEISKLVTASLLYRYWDKLNKILRVYLTVATIVLVLITSMGIYGFLSSAYQETANKDGIVTQQVESLTSKKKLYESTRDNILKEKQSLIELKGTLSKGSTTQFTDKKGNLVVKSNNSSIKQMESASKTDENLTSKLDATNDSIFSLETQILEVKTNGGAASELGPLKYLSGLTGVSMDRIINWLLLIIVFVFDPLAISLVIAANFAFSQLKNQYKENIYGEIVPNVSEPFEDDSWNLSNEEYEKYINDILPELYVKDTPSLLSEEDKKFDINNDGVLDKNEQTLKENSMLNDPNISAWRKRKIMEKRVKENDDLTLTY
jgi:hypothetical protein